LAEKEGKIDLFLPSSVHVSAPSAPNPEIVVGLCSSTHLYFEEEQRWGGRPRNCNPDSEIASQTQKLQPRPRNCNPETLRAINPEIALSNIALSFQKFNNLEQIKNAKTLTFELVDL